MMLVTHYNYLALVLFFFYAGDLSAQHDDHGHDSNHKSTHDHFHHHHAAIFNGVTTNFTHESTDYSVGIDYEYRISKLLGVGALIEYVAVENGEYIVGIPTFMHPLKNSYILAAPILVNAEEHHKNGGHGDHHEDPERKTNFAFRIGAGYNTHIGKLSFGPAAAFDIGNSNALLYGVNIGFGF